MQATVSPGPTPSSFSASRLVDIGFVPSVGVLVDLLDAAQFAHGSCGFADGPQGE